MMAAGTATTNSTLKPVATVIAISPRRISFCLIRACVHGGRPRARARALPSCSGVGDYAVAAACGRALSEGQPCRGRCHPSGGSHQHRSWRCASSRSARSRARTRSARLDRSPRSSFAGVNGVWRLGQTCLSNWKKLMSRALPSADRGSGGSSATNVSLGVLVPRAGNFCTTLRRASTAPATHAHRRCALRAAGLLAAGPRR